MAASRRSDNCVISELLLSGRDRTLRLECPAIASGGPNRAAREVIMIMPAHPPPIRTALLAGCIALGTGCAVGPDFHRPAAPADAGYAPAPLPASTASADVRAGESQQLIAGRDIAFEWWELFQSPKLNRLVAQAFAANPSLAGAQAAVAQAQELVYAQQGFYFPSVSAAYQAERHKVAGNVNSSETIGVQADGENKLPQAENPSALPHNLPSYYTFHTAELTVGFVPDVFGANRRQVESLAAQTDVQRFALEATYITLACNLVAAAIQEAVLRAQLDATGDIIAAEQKSLQILRDQLRLGFAMRIDVAAQEAALAQAQATLPPLQQQFEQTRDLMRALLGKLPNHADETIELEDLQLPPELPLSVPAKIIDQRPDVRAAEAQLHAANAEVGVAVAAMLPQFSITGAYGGNATQIPWMFRGGGPFWSLVGDVSQPLFEGGTLLHRKRAANAALKQAAAQYQESVMTAYQNVADTLQAALSDADALAADVEAENAAKVTFDLTRRQMQLGYVDSLTLLNAETSYQQSLLNRVQAQAARYGDTIALFQSLGGGWWNRTQVAAN
jgi:NodT family efflux transporter outer membrane factor (OMF) lipoprotein